MVEGARCWADEAKKPRFSSAAVQIAYMLAWCVKFLSILHIWSAQWRGADLFEVSTRVKGAVTWQSPATRRGSNVAVPNLPPDVLTDGPRARQYTPARPTSRRGRLGTATLQPPPASSYTHFRKRFSKIQVYRTYHTQKNSWVCIPHTRLVCGKRNAVVLIL